MFLNRTKDRRIITVVVRIPTTVAAPMTTRLAVSAVRLNIIQVLHSGLQE